MPPTATCVARHVICLLSTRVAARPCKHGWTDRKSVYVMYQIDATNSTERSMMHGRDTALCQITVTTR